jgi:hypothetical protein
MIILAALEADQPEETAAADLVQHLVIDAQDRVLLARIVLDPDLPDVLDLAPVPDKVLLLFIKISVTQKIKKRSMR